MDDDVLASASTWRRPMLARRSDEEHRTSTPLELFFDLCFVVAVAQAALGLHHALGDRHVADGVLGYLLVFFAIWWAWMNFTWFASAYDTDDVAYRLTTLVQIAGALVIAAGVPRALDHRDFAIVTAGYVLMRLAMVTQWLRAARDDPAHRRCCRRYAVGVTLVQVGWVLRLALPPGWDLVGFGVLAVAELAVPLWAERGTRTTWHREHIVERYGLFTMIVLGESVLSATLAVEAAADLEGSWVVLASTAVGGMLTVFAMWWLYFSKDAAVVLTSQRAAFVWGYGHYAVFASAAAVGAGLAVIADTAGSAPERLTATAATASFTVPVAAFVLAVGVLQWRPHHLTGWHSALAPVFALAVLAATFVPEPVLVTGILLAALVAVGVVLGRDALTQGRPRA
jgi:low temperature requirement protein LtrA